MLDIEAIEQRYTKTVRKPGYFPSAKDFFASLIDIPVLLDEVKQLRADYLEENEALNAEIQRRERAEQDLATCEAFKDWP